MPLACERLRRIRLKTCAICVTSSLAFENKTLAVTQRREVASQWALAATSPCNQLHAPLPGAHFQHCVGAGDHGRIFRFAPSLSIRPITTPGGRAAWQAELDRVCGHQPVQSASAIGQCNRPVQSARALRSPTESRAAAEDLRSNGHLPATSDVLVSSQTPMRSSSFAGEPP